MATKPFPVPSPKNVPWDKGRMDDKTFIEKHLGLQYPPDHVLKAGIELLKGERANLDGIYDTKQKPKGSHVLDEENKVGILKRIVGSIFPGWHVDEEKQTVSFTEDPDVDLADPPKPELKVGAKVSFTQGGKSYTGTILSINRTDNTAKVKDDKSDWSPDIPLGSLKLLSSPASAPVNASEQVLIQAPNINLAAEQLGPQRFKKALFPVDGRINYEDNGVKKVLNFSRKWLSRLAENVKQKAFDQIPLLALHPKDNTVNPDHYYGHLVDAELDDNWFYGIFETTKRGAQAVLENPLLPTSPGYLEDYTRTGDKKHFGPTLQHIAFTYTPAIPGVEKGWESVVAMSSDAKDAVVVDLSGETFADNPRKEDDRLDVQPEALREPQKEKEEEVEMEESTPTGVSLEEFNTLRDENREALKQLAENQRVLRHQGIRKMLNEEYGQAGVAKVHLDAAFDLLVAEEGVITLSESGDATFTDENKKALAVKTLLESCKGEIEFGEKGSQIDGSDNHEAEKMYEEYLAVLGGES